MPSTSTITKQLILHWSDINTVAELKSLFSQDKELPPGFLQECVEQDRMEPIKFILESRLATIKEECEAFLIAVKKYCHATHYNCEKEDNEHKKLSLFVNKGNVGYKELQKICCALSKDEAYEEGMLPGHINLEICKEVSSDDWDNVINEIEELEQNKLENETELGKKLRDSDLVPLENAYRLVMDYAANFIESDKEENKSINKESKNTPETNTLTTIQHIESQDQEPDQSEPDQSGQILSEKELEDVKREIDRIIICLSDCLKTHCYGNLAEDLDKLNKLALAFSYNVESRTLQIVMVLNINILVERQVNSKIEAIKHIPDSLRYIFLSINNVCHTLKINRIKIDEVKVESTHQVVISKFDPLFQQALPHLLFLSYVFDFKNGVNSFLEFLNAALRNGTMSKNLCIEFENFHPSLKKIFEKDSEYFLSFINDVTFSINMCFTAYHDSIKPKEATVFFGLFNQLLQFCYSFKRQDLTKDETPIQEQIFNTTTKRSAKALVKSSPLALSSAIFFCNSIPSDKTRADVRKAWEIPQVGKFIPPSTRRLGSRL